MLTPPIRYIQGAEDLLDSIQPLWEELNNHHKERSPHFRYEYEVFTFKTRKGILLEKARRGSMSIHVAEDENRRLPVAYCIATLSESWQGEIESIFVHENYRGLGVGDYLMQMALGWLEQSGAKVKTVHVAAGNEQAFTFYTRYGFFPRQTVLKQKTEISS